MRHVRRPSLRLEVVPWLNVLVVAWLLTLLQSSYIYAPGVSMSLAAKSAEGPANPTTSLNLPTATAGTPAGRRVDVTLSVQPSDVKIEDTVFYLDNGIYHFVDLPRALLDHAKKVRKQPGDQPVLLLLAPAKTDMATLFIISEMARTAGFGTVQLAEKAPNAASQTEAPTNAAGAATP
jgi:biopolymer transport protein ExbD